MALYASIYDNVRTIVNLSGRFDLKKGIEERIGEGSIDRINKEAILTSRTNLVRISLGSYFYILSWISFDVLGPM